MLTYGDGVSDVPLDRLVAFHKNQGKLATVTAVRALARFGNIIFEGDRVADFAEKRVTENAWINGGYMVMEPGVLEYLHKDDDVLEVDLLERLTEDGQLAGYRHEGFWQCMDTLRDKQGLERLWLSGSPPWKRW
jgi:glucose-1-phosphate cytidylyltransferase